MAHSRQSLNISLNMTLQVRVKTGDVPSADFDGKVFLTLFSYWDNSGEIQLINDVARFDRDTIQVRTIFQDLSSYLAMANKTQTHWTCTALF